jgi:hypothetical protein
MATPLPPTAFASERAAQRAMERYVLTLLHRAKKPEALAVTPLMEVICLATGIRQPVAALEHVVRSALEGSDWTATVRRDAIIEVDFDGALTNGEYAARNGISRRHFQRRRAKAVAAIAQYATGLIESGRIAQAEVDSKGAARDQRLRRCDAQWRFDREAAAFARARESGLASEMRATAASLLRLATSRASRTLALGFLADANVHLGRADDALEAMRDLPASKSLVLRAKLALLDERPGEAEEYAQAALAHFDGAERYGCHAVISQARLLRAAPWEPPREAASLPWRSWERVAMEVERARHLSRQGWRSEAEALARRAYRLGDQRGNRAIAARCAAALHAVAEARGAAEQSRWWRACAIDHLLPTQDRLLATGLFWHGPLDCSFGPDRMLGDVLYRRLCLIVPQMLGDGAACRSAVCNLLGAIFDLPQTYSRSFFLLAESIASVAQSGSALPDYLEAAVEPAAEMLALARAALTGRSWQQVFPKLRESVLESAIALRPAVPRTIPIAVPQPGQSRLAGIDHLRDDEKRVAALGRSLEDLADLRLRFVPLRSVAGDALSRHGRHSITGTPRSALGSADSRQR